MSPLFLGSVCADTARLPVILHFTTNFQCGADANSVFQPLNVHCIPVVVDLVSLNLLKGSTLHYATELIGSSFRIQDTPQAKEGGACGCGVSWEAA